MTLKKYGIFGGTFNPPHIAHSILAENICEQLELDKIIFIPSGNPPLKNSIPAKQRMEMAQLAFSDNPHFEISDIETKDLDVRSYTVNTLKKLSEKYRNDHVKLFLLIGADNYLNLNKWKDPGTLFDYSEVVVLNRPDFELEDHSSEFKDKVKFIDTPFLEISSSMIREKVLNGLSVKYLLDKKVEEYVIRNNLYKNP
ncbi:MAG TPA: nicotinate-nucleotide adenylyltransferase [Ignavibacteria bacterium]|nr:nicotinate-nucleotide adenylyltransferase [Ignavibacteria bacterium]HMR39500.1 nicotinate-nucleotide adenylyltransferase [Ignavibacteria bacterium]